VTGRGISDHQLAKIIKRLARSAGLDAEAFSGHSLRSGLATAAAEGGATERSIIFMDQTRHRSLKQVRKYIRRGSCSAITPPRGPGCEAAGRTLRRCRPRPGTVRQTGREGFSPGRQKGIPVWAAESAMIIEEKTSG
jgi:hypothetical protein